MRKLVCVILLGLILRPLEAQEFILGRNEFDMRLIREYTAEEDTLLLYSRGELVPSDSIPFSLSPGDDSRLVHITLDIPLVKEFLGSLEVRMVSKADTSQQIASPVQREVRAPKPELVSVMRQDHWLQEANFIRWEHEPGAVAVRAIGHHFFLGDEPELQFSDPYLNAEHIQADTSTILFDLAISPGAQPGMKTLRIENYGGAADTVEFNLYSEARPRLRPIARRERPIIYTGVARRIIIPMHAPQNVEDIYLATDSQGRERVENALISIEPGTPSQMEGLAVRMVILERSQANFDLFVTTKNIDAHPFRLGRLSDVVVVEDKDIRFNPVRKYVGDYLSELSIASESIPNITDLTENTGYTLRSPNNEAHRVTYEEDKHALVFDNPVKLTVTHQGNWRLEEGEDKYVAYVGVRKIPAITGMNWQHQDQELREMFGDQPYATRTEQIYTLTVDIQDLSGNSFPTEAIEFFNGKGTIAGTPTKKPTKGNSERFVFDVQISEDIEPNFEYPIIYKPINRLIGRVTFNEFNRPVGKHEAQEFLLVESLDNSPYPLHNKDSYQTKVPYVADRNSLTLRLNAAGYGYGKQTLHVEATLYDDTGEQKGNSFSGTIRSDKPRLTIQFPRQNRAGYEDIHPWDAVYIKAEQDFQSYSPTPSAEEQDIRNTEYTWEQEFVFAGSHAWKNRVDIVTPVQQSVYVFEGDSVRASLFNVGVNMLWYHRQASDYRSFHFLSFGISLYTSELDRLANSQYASLGLAGLLNFNIAGKMEMAVGVGGILEYRFKARQGRKTGLKTLPSLVIQMRLPLGRASQ